MLIFARVVGGVLLLVSLFYFFIGITPDQSKVCKNNDGSLRAFCDYEATVMEESRNKSDLIAGTVFLVFGLLSFAGGEMVKRRRVEILKKCLRCAELVKSDALVCRFCQHDFAAAEKARQAATFAPSEPAQKLCPKCHQSVMKEAVSCKHCGHQFVARNIRRA